MVLTYRDFIYKISSLDPFDIFFDVFFLLSHFNNLIKIVFTRFEMVL